MVMPPATTVASVLGEFMLGRLLTMFAASLILIAASPQKPLDRAARLLNRHNLERQALGAAPLRWDDKLAAHAAAWAEHLARTGTFDHADQSDEGENLWAGTVGAYTPEQMVDSWISEKPLYKSGRFPDVSKTGNWVDVGHYTQLIWGNTKAVGCAVVSNAEDDILVCRYDPPGNWMGQFPFGESVPPKMEKKLGKHIRKKLTARLPANLL
jgi:Cysteine-rich secretory protein family